MKRAATWLLGITLALTAALPAQAVDMKVKGIWDYSFGWVGNPNFLGKGHDNQIRGGNDRFLARQRIRTQIDFIASEYVSGVLMFEIGNIDWGMARGNVGRSSGGALDADGVNIETKRAYLNWVIPGMDTWVRMGIQSLALPMATGYCNPIMYADVAGISLSHTFNSKVAATFFWARPFNQYLNDGPDRSLDDEMDMFALSMPVTLSGASITPWAMFANIGASSGYYNYIINYQDSAYGMDNAEQHGDTQAWWAGTAFNLTAFDPLSFSMNVMYGDMNKLDLVDRSGETRPIGTGGWFVDARLDYRLGWGKPGVLAWWTSGDSADADEDGKYGRIPVVGIDGTYGPTSFGLGGTAGLGVDGIVSPTGVGTWGVALQVADMKFLDRLSHTLRIAYYQGTNDHELAKKGRFLPLSGEALYMTDRDRAIEINFDHSIQIMPNLTSIVELGYIHLSMDENTWDSHSTPNKGKVGAHTDDAWKAQVLFRYRF